MSKHAAGTNGLRYWTVARARPVEATMYVFLPVALAAVQVVNGLVNEVPMSIATAFALGLVAFALVTSRHHRAVYNLERVTADAW